MEKRRGMPGPREDGWREIFEKIVFLASEESVQVSIAEFGNFRGVDKKTGNAYKIEPCRRNLNRPPEGGGAGGVDREGLLG